jgi:hypothetical protein
MECSKQKNSKGFWKKKKLLIQKQINLLEISFFIKLFTN